MISDWGSKPLDLTENVYLLKDEVFSVNIRIQAERSLWKLLAYNLIIAGRKEKAVCLYVLSVFQEREDIL